MARLTSRCSPSGVAALSPSSLALASEYVSLSHAPLLASPRTQPGKLENSLTRSLQIVHTRESVLTSYHATPAQALRMHVALRARHSLAMHFATFAGSDVEALDPIVELEQAKRKLMTLSLSTGTAGEDIVIDGSADHVRRTTTAAAAGVGDWWMEGGMGVIDVGETAIVQVGESEPVGALVCAGP